MNKITLAIVEDEFAVAEDIKLLLTEQDYEVTGVFEKAENIESEIVLNPPDLLLVDIRLAGKMSGVELVEKVKQKISIPVIYITANSDSGTYQKAKETKPNAFLVKPFTPANLLAAIDLALFNFAEQRTPERIEKPQTDRRDFDTYIHKSLFIKSNGKHKKLNPESILFIEGAGSYLHIQTDADRHTLAQNLNTFLRKTPLDNIVRVHRSYLVNINRVESFEDSWLFIKNNKLPIGETYKSDFFSRIHCL